MKIRILGGAFLVFLFILGSILPGWRAGAAENPVSAQGEVILGFVGDILPDRGVRPVIRRKGLPGLFRNLPAIFGDCDLVCANLEAALTDATQTLVKTFRFNSPLNLGQYLEQNKIRVVNLANNHSVDFGKAGLRDTVDHLTEYGVMPFGFGENQSAALAPRLYQIKGLTVAFIGAVCFPLEGYVYLPDRFDVGRWDAALVGARIRKARTLADLVVVNLHWGMEFTHYPTASQVEMGHFCIDQGADLVIGHHPHVLQGVEIYRQRPIFYSLGNFVFDQEYGPARESVLAKIRVDSAVHQIRQITLVPVLINHCIPEPAAGEDTRRIMEHIRQYSEAFPESFAGSSFFR